MKDVEQILPDLNGATILRLTWHVSRKRAVYLDLAVYGSHRIAAYKRLYLKPFQTSKQDLILAGSE